MGITLFDVDHKSTVINESHWKNQDHSLISTLNMKLGIVVGYFVVVGQYNCIIRDGDDLHLSVWDSHNPTSAGMRVHPDTVKHSWRAWGIDQHVFRSPEDRDFVLEWVRRNTTFKL